MSERFFSTQPISGTQATLDGPEAHHLLNVMRAGVGTTVTLFDNSGAEFTAVVESIRRSEATLHITERRETSRELSFSLTVGVALPKGDRQKWLVEKLTELGVTTLVPLITERGIAQPTASAIERLSRSVIEAAKQCGRNRLMQIANPQPFSTFVANPTAGDPRSPVTRRLIAHPHAPLLSTLEIRTPLPTAIAIGPEGGFADVEVHSAAEAGWERVSLGGSILRIETAAIALAAAIATNSAPAS
ncbi:MAG TPA: RsmE family RNA methyltransferase [Lacipirellulaceae bacterium]|jgi:16S rRNA (uracil1498-N3)-methyltransferase|nr:RsmE family RNA methyltransferase [Lacipirellulaceae bacterium]